MLYNGSADPMMADIYNEIVEILAVMAVPHPLRDGNNRRGVLLSALYLQLLPMNCQ